MRFISVRDLNLKPREVWRKLQEEEMIITSNGKPVALLSGVNEDNLEKTLIAFRRSRALLALEEMQNKSQKMGLDKISDAEIELEIQEVRKDRRK